MGFSITTCHDLAKRLSYYLYFFSFLFFFLNLLHRREYRKVSHSHSHMVLHDRSHDKHGKVVHRSYNSCISSVENLSQKVTYLFCDELDIDSKSL